MNEKLEIPIDMAIKICEEIRKENKNKFFSFLGYQCLGCIKFCEGDHRKMLFNKNPSHSGCYLVNVKYLKEKNILYDSK